MTDAQAIAADSVECRSVTIVNERGLHARASAKFVALAQTFDAQVFVRRGGETVDACSIMDLLMLAAGPGCAIEIEARGKDAAAAVDALAALVESKFGEDS